MRFTALVELYAESLMGLRNESMALEIEHRRPEVVERGKQLTEFLKNRDYSAWIEKRDEGLLICKACGQAQYFHYDVSPEDWQTIVPREFQECSICLPCFNAFAEEAGAKYNIRGDVMFIGGNHGIAFECTQQATAFLGVEVTE